MSATSTVANDTRQKRVMSTSVVQQSNQKPSLPQIKRVTEVERKKSGKTDLPMSPLKKARELPPV